MTDQRTPILSRSEVRSVRREPRQIQDILAPALTRLRRWLAAEFGDDATHIALWWDGPLDGDDMFCLGIRWCDGPDLCRVLTALDRSFRRGRVIYHSERWWTDELQRRSAEAFCAWTGLPSLLEPPGHPNGGRLSPIWAGVPLGKHGRPAYRWWWSVLDGWIPLADCPHVGPHVLERAMALAAVTGPEPQHVKRAREAAAGRLDQTSAV
jgi:hypothetical protein